jgi:hypothetical protein
MYLDISEIMSTHVFSVPFTKAFETVKVLACADARTRTSELHLAGVVKCVEVMGMLRLRSHRRVSLDGGLGCCWVEL